MKGCWIIILFVMSSHLQAVGQDSTANVKRTYLQAGTILPIPLQAEEGFTVNASLIRETEKSLVIGFRYYNTRSEDPNYPAQGGILGKGSLIHKVNEFNFSVGKVKKIKQNITFIIATGPTYVSYVKPENIREQSRGFASFGGTQYDYDFYKYNLLGWSIRFDSNFIPLRFWGLSFGVLYNYNKHVPNGGISMNLLLGKLKDKHNI